MANITTTIKSADLDFDTIKTKLKDYIKQKTEFTDYNFEASGLSNILDVLAYNTHLNGLTANLAINESFLQTAQLRSSVVSLAEGIGYVPKSYSSSRATTKITVTINDVSRPDSITMPAGQTFSTSVDGVSYTFRTLDALSAVDNGSGIYYFKDENDRDEITIYEGTQRTKTFYVGQKQDNQVYVVPDETLDYTTMKVKVYPSSSSAEEESKEYTNLNTSVRITEDSRHYQIKEVPNGYYEIIFGDGLTTGQAPVAGNKIEVTYLTTAGSAANGASVFESTSNITVSGYGTYTIVPTIVSASGAGAEKESIETIRQNAPVAFAAQQRLVTAEDYTSRILSEHNDVLLDVFSWGGADNDPPIYGRVYSSLKFKDNISDQTKQATKDSIVSQLSDNFGIMSIDTYFTDPEDTFLEINVVFNYNPDLTNQTPRSLQNSVNTLITSYFSDNLNKFGKVFRRSNLISLIDESNDSILNTRMIVKAQQRFTPVTGKQLGYEILFPLSIAQPDDVYHRVTSGTFVFNGKSCIIRNKLNSTRLEVFSLGDRVEVDNVGYYDIGGKVVLEGFNPTIIAGGTQLKISVVPANESTIKPLRNYILQLDPEALTSRAQADYQEGEGI